MAVYINCQVCNKIVETFPSRLGRKKYCSRECKAEYMRQHLSGENSPMYGKKHTEEDRRKMRENHWSKKGGTPWDTGLTKETNEQLARCSIRMKNSNPMKNPATVEKQSQTLKKRYRDGLKNSHTGHKWTRDGIICECGTDHGIPPITGHKRTKNGLICWCGTDHGIPTNEGHKFNGQPCPKCGDIHQDRTGKNNIMFVPEVKKKYLSIMAVVNKDPERNRKLSETEHWWTDKVMKANDVKPNKKEIIFYQILQQNFPDEWKYTGDGQVIIGGCCPDYTNCNGKKQLIEMFGDYWHSPEKIKNDPTRSEEFRKTHFAKFGFKTLIIWEHELKNPEQVIQKVKEFSEQ